MRKRLAIILAAVAVMAMVTAASADQFFANETDFVNALAAGYYLEDFNSVNLGDYQGSSSATFTISGPPPFSYDLTTGTTGLFGITGAMSVGSASETLNIDLSGSPTPVYAVGGWFFPTAESGDVTPGTVQVSFNSGNLQSITYPDPLTDPLAMIFLGFISDTPITLVSIFDPTESTVYPSLDHLYVGAAAVPVPPAVLLLGSGLLGLLGWRRYNS